MWLKSLSHESEVVCADSSEGRWRKDSETLAIIAVKWRILGKSKFDVVSRAKERTEEEGRGSGSLLLRMSDQPIIRLSGKSSSKCWFPRREGTMLFHALE